MSINSVSGAAQALPQPKAGGVTSKLRVAAWSVTSLLLLVTVSAVALNRFDFDGAGGKLDASDVAQPYTISSAPSDILDDAQRETSRVAIAAPTRTASSAGR